VVVPPNEKFTFLPETKKSLKCRLIEINTSLGHSCDIQGIGTKFGAILEPEFSLNSTLLKVHVSNGYHRFSKA
jgi:hypothetical protein